MSARPVRVLQRVTVHGVNAGVATGVLAIMDRKAATDVRSHRWRARLAALVAAYAFVAGAVSPARAADDLPGRVGRVANVQGALYHSLDDGAGDWEAIGLNYPVAQGDNLWAERGGHAEIDYGGGQFRLAGDTNVHVSRLDERQFALFVAAGRVILRVRMLDQDDSVHIDTPSTQVAVTRPGLYRIDVASDIARTTLIVREGEADVATAAGWQQVLPGQAATLAGTADVVADVFSAGGIDGFDAWSAARDRVYEQPRQNAYVSRQMVGEADLAAYGTWRTYADYGAVWYPTVDTDWAPYRFGYWTWLPGWGYTWVDAAPWGYAPFHYGRWVFLGSRWGWCPGGFVARPLWAPALVAWYGGSGWYSDFGGAVFGWVPLGWREPFIPWWGGCSARCFARYNRPYAVNVAERDDARPTHFANWSVPGGITAVSGAALASGRPVASNRVPVGTNVAFAPALLTAPPAQRPAPVRPGMRQPGNGVPLPVSTQFAARQPIAPAGATNRIAAPPPAPLGAALPRPGYAVRPPADAGRSAVPPTTARSVPPSQIRPAPSAARVAPVPPLPQIQPAPQATRVVPAPITAPQIQPAPQVGRVVPPPPQVVPLPAPQPGSAGAPAPAERAPARPIQKPADQRG